MKRRKEAYIFILALLFSVSTYLGSTAYAAKAPLIPKVKFLSAPVKEYMVGDRVRFDIASPNYGHRVEYRVILWDDSTKTPIDLWNASNGYPTRYYTKWQPWGNNVFTLGWPIFKPGSYRITVYVKRVGIPNNKAYLKGQNCDDYIESEAFVVKPRDEEPQNTDNGGGTKAPVDTNDPDTNGDNGSGSTPSGSEGTGTTPPAQGGTETTPPSQGGTVPNPGTGVSQPLIVESAGVYLSDGTSIAGKLTGSNTYEVDLTDYIKSRGEAAMVTGVRSIITINKNAKINILGTEFAFSAHTPKILGPADFGLEDNDPPGVSIRNLRDNYSNSEGYYTESTTLTDESNNSVTITVKVKVK